MGIKNIVTILLLLFVAASVGFMVFKGGGSAVTGDRENLQAPTYDNQQAARIATEEPITAPGSAREEPTAKPARNSYTSSSVDQQGKVVVYYFHGNTRCVTCRTIENFTRAAVGNGFPDELKNGLIEFRSVNVEEPANEHFVQDYQLVTRSVVLARFSGARQEKWKNMDRVWELVRDNDSFARYIQTQTKMFLRGA
jgi:hypothetical protein